MEDKLPRDERIEWAKQMCAVAGDTRFEKFRQFLQIRKSVLERVELMGSKSGGDTGYGGISCEYCGKPNHATDKCFTKQ